MKDGLNNLLTAFGETLRDLPGFLRLTVAVILLLVGLFVAAWVLLSFGTLKVFVSLISSGLLLLGLGLLGLAGSRSAFLTPRYAVGLAVALLIAVVLINLPWSRWSADVGVAYFAEGQGSQSSLWPNLGFGATRRDLSRTGLSVLDIWFPAWILLNAVLLHKVAQARKSASSLLTGNLVWIALLVAASHLGYLF